MVEGTTFWGEFMRVYEVLARPHIVHALMFGTGIFREPDVIDGETFRPAMVDDLGVRWLLDGSGECA